MFKVTSLNSFSVGLKIGIGLITSKILAVFVGPGGMALVGNLRNFLTSLESISTLGFQNGIVKYVAENQRNKSEFQKILATVFICLVTVAIVLSLILEFNCLYSLNNVKSLLKRLFFKVLLFARFERPF